MTIGRVNFAITEGAINTAYRKTPAWPIIVNLRADPFESAPHDSGMYIRWYADLLWLFVPIQGEVAKFAATLKEYPPVTGGSLSGGLSYRTVQIQQALDMLNSVAAPRNCYGGLGRLLGYIHRHASDSGWPQD